MPRPLRRAALALALVLPSLATAASAQSAPDADRLRGQIRAWRVAHDVDVLREFTELLAIPNLASDSANVRRNAAHIVRMLERRGVAARLLEAPGSPPAVYGELPATGPSLPSGQARTVVIYAHYDGQPVDSTQWATPPWTPTLRDGPLQAGGKPIAMPTTPGTVRGEWWLYARSAGDDKAPIVAALAALDALRASGAAPSVNLKFFFEGEEEAGSGHLRDMLERHAALLKGDLWLFCDGPVHQSRRQQMLFGVRGMMGGELTVYGPKRALHSGHYGNWAYNPITLLANLIASMRDDDGRIRIAGYDDDVRPIGAAERRALRTVPPIDSALRAELQLGGTEANDAALGERILRPALNLRGFRGGNVGPLASNTINTEARASIDFRLVPNETPARIRALVERHARAQGYHVADHEPTAAERMAHRKLVRIDWEAGYPSAATPMSDPAARAAQRAVDAAAGAPVIKLPMLGGSLPLYQFAQVLKTPFVVLPIANHDDNQHAANENLRLQNLWDGIELLGGVMAGIGRAWERVVP